MRLRNKTQGKVLEYTFGDMVSRLADKIRGAQVGKQKVGLMDRYPFIPNSASLVIQQLMAAGRLCTEPRPYYFLDVGCGMGNIMILAHHVGFMVAGIEYDEEMERIALYEMRKQIIVRQERDGTGFICNCDAFRFRSYDRFDVVYYYTPMYNPTLEKKLEERIEDRVKVGCIIIANGKRSHRIDKDDRFCRVSRDIWRKIA